MLGWQYRELWKAALRSDEPWAGLALCNTVLLLFFIIKPLTKQAAAATHINIMLQMYDDISYCVPGLLGQNSRCSTIMIIPDKYLSNAGLNGWMVGS